MLKWKEKILNGAMGIPPSLPIPTNVYVTGTVNVDESTYMFSPKVLDRANVIEFNDVIIDGDDDSSRAWDRRFVFKKADCRGLFEGDNSTFPERKDFEKAREYVLEPLKQLAEILKPYHLHFGYRTINELSRFVSLAKENVENFDVDELLDIQILQKILPKFHGTRARLEKPLWEILGFCYGEAGGGEEQVGTEGEARRKRAETFDKTARHPRCAQKCARMLRSFKEQGYTSFIE